MKTGDYCIIDVEAVAHIGQDVAIGPYTQIMAGSIIGDRCRLEGCCIEGATLGEGVSVCPGPNLAYFSGVVSLKEMADHIYGRINLMTDNGRPNMFIKELEMYVDYLKKMVDESITPLQEKQVEYFESFKANLNEGIDYYKNVFSDMIEESKIATDKLIDELEFYERELACIMF